MIPQKGSTLPLLESEFLVSLDAALQHHANAYRVWNFSLGTDTVCSLDKFSKLAEELDNLQEKYRVSFVISAGNYDTPPLPDFPRIGKQDGNPHQRRAMHLPYRRLKVNERSNAQFFHRSNDSSSVGPSNSARKLALQGGAPEDQPTALEGFDSPFYSRSHRSGMMLVSGWASDVVASKMGRGAGAPPEEYLWAAPYRLRGRRNGCRTPLLGVVVFCPTEIDGSVVNHATRENEIHFNVYKDSQAVEGKLPCGSLESTRTTCNSVSFGDERNTKRRPRWRKWWGKLPANCRKDAVPIFSNQQNTRTRSHARREVYRIVIGE
jgi:hypothetical protein